MMSWHGIADPWRNARPALSELATSWRIDETYVKVCGQWAYLYRAVDKHGNTIDFYLSPTRNTAAAKRFLGKALNGLKDWEKPRVINTDKASTYGAALAELKQEGRCPEETLHRQVKYLNNVIEADHGKLKQLIRPVRGFKTLKTAYATIKGFEVMRALRKGQASATTSKLPWHRPRAASARLVLVPPLPRRDELPLPQPCPLSAGFLLRATISALGIALEVERPALAHYRGGNVAAIDRAHRDNAPVAIAVARFTPYLPALHQPTERLGCAPAASPGLRRQAAGLGSFRCVDTPKPNALTCDLERVAIDNAGGAFEGWCGGPRARGGREQEHHGSGEPPPRSLVLHRPLPSLTLR